MNSDMRRKLQCHQEEACFDEPTVTASSKAEARSPLRQAQANSTDFEGREAFLEVDWRARKNFHVLKLLFKEHVNLKISIRQVLC
ncbi:hypothetical protein QR680_018490 [Steinernema hermaphroditum]|uniref:Uncharacterized protein n=1 Tax=Steinernema hermaphroditum TaxID=289476 RepID=A0AA39HK83_9BILA|nr:hypothetical protein QR680_018490 [Steinernema hermaphroditum]